MVTRPIRNRKRVSPQFSYQPHRHGRLSECIRCHTERHGIDRANMLLRSTRHQAKKCSCADVSEKFEGIATVGKTYSTAELARLMDPKIPLTQPPQEPAMTDDQRKFTAYRCDEKLRAENVLISTFRSRHCKLRL